ncbi:Uncharacterised protein [Providencia rettgeri]|nr:Uncharacterised protein [Providencia rettgeri]
MKDFISYFFKDLLSNVLITVATISVIIIYIIFFPNHWFLLSFITICIVPFYRKIILFFKR